jgi:Tfp pilus assembly protein PilZ
MIMEDNDIDIGKDSVTVVLIRKILEMTAAQQQSLLNQLENISANGVITTDREDTRRSFKESIQFALKDKTYTGISQDISAGGMFIKTDDTFSVGQIITINIPIANKSKHIKVPAQIVRIESEGIGVEFLKKFE